jgi:hypothetical protein
MTQGLKREVREDLRIIRKEQKQYRKEMKELKEENEKLKDEREMKAEMHRVKEKVEVMDMEKDVIMLLICKMNTKNEHVLKDGMQEC